ncbi:AAA family ATPase [Hydrocarboniphaga effusa]|uniref:AAA family ATPase n=1 Tax=Hydrocarboniphaga effusa TaxID=243629 RepID=UPI003BAD8A68
MNITVADYNEAAAGQEVDGIDMAAEPARLELPSTWHARYTDQEKADVGTVIDWLNRTGKPQSWLAKVSRVHPSTLNSVLAGAYPSPTAKFLSPMLDAMRVQDERAGHRGIPFVDTSVWKLAASVYHRARTYRNVGVFASNVGTGKTTAAKEYSKRYTNIYVIECVKNMSASALLDEMCEQLNLVAEARGGSKEKKLKLVLRVLTGSDGLFIVDEAETLHPESLHYLRRIRDLAKIGIVLQGTAELIPMVKAEGGKFDQIRSRVGFWPATVQAIKRDDADEITLAAFEDLETPPAIEVLDAIWNVCGGSARVLAESLIPALRDYGLRKGRPLNVALVRQVAAEVLNMGVGAARREVK